MIKIQFSQDNKITCLYHSYKKLKVNPCRIDCMQQLQWQYLQFVYKVETIVSLILCILIDLVLHEDDVIWNNINL